MDPRHSLAGGIILLLVALAASFAVAASVWAGSVAREIVVQQHVRRLTLETQQLASDLGQAVSARLEAVRSAGPLPPAAIFEHLMRGYPDLGWIAAADAKGAVIAGQAAIDSHSNAAAKSWFIHGHAGVWIGLTKESPAPANVPFLGDMSAPLKDALGNTVGVVVAHLTWPWASGDVQRLSTALNSDGSAQSLVLNDADLVVVGPAGMRDTAWQGKLMSKGQPVETPHFERLPNGDTALIIRAAVKVIGAAVPGTWWVQLSEPKASVYQRANSLAIRIWWISACLGAITAVLGALGARHLTNRLKKLTLSAAAVGRNEIARIEVPSGRDEVAQLAAAFAKVLDDLRVERTELLNLSSELERRVAVRTREVERLAEESRYAAIVRERLRIARDLHDTLAHSMMAMLSEVRLLRKLQAHDPQSLPGELARAEEVAHAGLNEARSAITQMRANSVRDIGLGPALGKALERFGDRTGLKTEFAADAEAARFGDERAEVIFRMTEEALRNVERHARASGVRVNLRSDNGTHLTLLIEDDGVGFDPSQPRPGHFGLIGLKEQARLIGAEFDISSAANCGTCLRTVLRIAPEAL
ncbi:MAG TPA: histidine kinase [Steroidobacteraceae bacterium]|nr:histidine kinase [Steroidobacteraceae bacterium]